MYLHVVTQHETADPNALAGALAEVGHRTATSSLAADTIDAAAGLGHRLAADWASDRPDAVVAVGWLAGLAAQVGAREHPVPVIQRLFAPGRTDDIDRRRLENAVARGASRVLALCSSDTETLVALGVRRSAVRVVPHGVDTVAFADEGPSWPAADGRRLVARPANHAAAARLTALLTQLPRCELVLLTSTATRAGATSALTEVVARHPVASRVRLMDTDRADASGPDRRAPALAALLRSADLVLAVDDEEQSLDLVLQAMATGVPVVAPAIGALPDVIADGVTGVLVPPSPETALGDAVQSLLGDALSRESQGLAAGDRARASFGWPAVAAAVARVAEEVADRGRHTTSAAASTG